MEFEWHQFKIRGVYEETGRKRTIKLLSHDEISAEIEAQNRGLMPPYEIEEEFFPEPTERQINYALDLGIKILPMMTRKDVSALIEREEEDDHEEPNCDLMIYAYDRNIYFSPYIGRKSLCNLVFSTLTGADRIAFFCFAVYRSLTGNSEGNLDMSPVMAQCYEFAGMYNGDKAFENSMDEYSGEDLIFFGTRYEHGEAVGYGGSKRRKAYQLAAQYWNVSVEYDDDYNFDEPIDDEQLFDNEPVTDTGIYLSEYNLDGANGKIRLTENAVVIKRTGIVGFFFPSEGKNYVIPIRDIYDVHIHEATSFFGTCYIRFVCFGDNLNFLSPSDLPKGGNEFFSTVTFGDRKNLNVGERIRNYVTTHKAFHGFKS